MSDEHFPVDGTLIEAWTSQKSFRRKAGNGKRPGPGGEVDFHGEKRTNQTRESTTDAEARLFKKSKGSEAKLGYLGHVLMENRNGLLVQTFLTEANGRAERDAAMLMAEASVRSCAKAGGTIARWTPNSRPAASSPVAMCLFCLACVNLGRSENMFRVESVTGRMPGRPACGAVFTT